MKAFVRPPTSRIAPTPSGYLHLGNAVSFALTWAIVRAHRGKLRLRIDDLDAPRMREEFVEDLFEQLEWLGIDWDDGPSGPGEVKSKFSQAYRTERYAEVLRELSVIEGGPVYACDCPRSRARSVDGVYGGACRNRGLPLDEDDLAWRVKVPMGCEPRFHDLAAGEIRARLDLAMGDFVIKRRDGFAGYHLASIVDDLDHGVDLVVRGGDLRDSTAAQVYLSRFVAGGEAFAKALFCHHPILVDRSGAKLAKSRGASALREARGEWRTPEPVFRAAGALAGFWDVATGEELVRAVASANEIRFVAPLGQSLLKE